MEQRISLITLGVADLDRAREFYERLGWHGQETQETVLFQAGGLGLVLWAEGKLADDVGAAVPREPGTFRGVTLAYNVRTREEVDAILATARAAGATVRGPAADTFYGGYAGHFADPDGTRGRWPTTPGSRSRRTARSPSPSSAAKLRDTPFTRGYASRHLNR